MTAGLLLSLASFAWGQRGGFHGGGGVHGGGGFAARGALRAGSGSAPRGGMRAGGMAFVGPTRWFRAGSNFRRPERGPRIIIGDFRRGRDFGRRRFYPYGAYPVYGWYSPFLWDWETSSYDSRNDYSDRYAELQYQTAAEINRLAEEVEQLREERTGVAEQQSPRPLTQPEAEQDLPVILVFLDKHIQEIHNYAVANETVLAFDGTRVRKYPLIDIDLAATMKLNDERGVRFDVPNPVMN